MSHVRCSSLQQAMKLFNNQHGSQTSQSYQFLQVRPMSETELSEGFSEAWCRGSLLRSMVVHQFRLSSAAQLIDLNSAEFSRKNRSFAEGHMDQLGIWRSGCGLWFGQSWDHWDHQAAASEDALLSASLQGMFHILQQSLTSARPRSLRANDARTPELFGTHAGGL